MEFRTIRKVKNGYLYLRKLFFSRPGAKARVIYDVAIPGYFARIPKSNPTRKPRRKP